MKWFLLLLLLMTSCGRESEDARVKSPAVSPAAADGVVNGGGGFDDTYALEALEQIKSYLNIVFGAASDKIFESLPEGKRKAFILSLINKLEYKNTYAERYGRKLKFDYDLKKVEIYAMKSFIDTFPYGRFKTMSISQKDRVIYEIVYDILREISHFYGVGNTEETDKEADAWAMSLFYHLGNDVVVCEEEGTDAALFFHKLTGLGTAFTKAQPEVAKALELLKSNKISIEDLTGASYFIPYSFGDELYRTNYERSQRFVRKFRQITQALETDQVEGYYVGVIQEWPLSSQDYESMTTSPENSSKNIDLGVLELKDNKIVYSAFDNKGEFTAHEEGGEDKNEAVTATREVKVRAIFDLDENSLDYTYSTADVFSSERDKEIYGDKHNPSSTIQFKCESFSEVFKIEDF